MRHEEFRDRVAIVTGGASGIGAASAAEFVAEGARVAIFDINGEGATQQAKSLDPEGDRARGFAVDVSDEESVAAALASVVEAWGAVNYLVNCAVSFVAAGQDATTQEWERSLGVNVRGNAMLTAAVARKMGAGSAVVNISSISAHVAQPTRWTYNATKGAIVSMTRCQALDLAPNGIRVNVISPGWIWTPEVEKAAEGDRAKWEPVWGKFHVLRRLGEAREVARAALFLCSSDASFITGTELFVDGGYNALGGEGLGDSSSFAGSE